MKIDQMLHSFSVRTLVYDIHVSQQSFFLFPKIFKYVVIELKNAIFFLLFLFNEKVGQ